MISGLIKAPWCKTRSTWFSYSMTIHIQTKTQFKNLNFENFGSMVVIPSLGFSNTFNSQRYDCIIYNIYYIHKLLIWTFHTKISVQSLYDLIKTMEWFRIDKTIVITFSWSKTETETVKWILTKNDFGTTTTIWARAIITENSYRNDDLHFVSWPEGKVP